VTPQITSEGERGRRFGYMPPIIRRMEAGRRVERPPPRSFPFAPALHSG
jgi:hypothetical protein